MAIVMIDIERRLELATQELLKAVTILTDIVGENGVRIYHDTSIKASYPAAAINVINAPPMGERTGWYGCGLQLLALTYRQDDESKNILKKVAGCLRGWAQQTNLASQFNATAIAKATATALDVRETWLDGMSFDQSEDRVQEIIIPVAVLCRPTQAETT